MELQELALKAVTSQLRYELSPRFPDVRGRFIEELTAELELPMWGWGDEFLNFGNDERALTLIAGGREARSQFEYVVNIEDVISTTATLFEKVLTDFNVGEVGFIGVRTYWAAAADDFEALRDWAREAMVSATLGTALGPIGRLTDVGWVFEFMGEDPKHRLRMGPMKREQLKQILQHAREDDLPEAFLYLDLDRLYNDTRHGRDEVLARWEQSLRRNIELATQFGSELTGSQPFA